MLVLLKKEKKEMLIEYCVERFGISKEIFENYQLDFNQGNGLSSDLFFGA